MTRRVFLMLGTGVSILTSGCELPPAHGDANAFIVGATPALWEEVEEVFLEAMEPTVQTVRNERPFRITHQDPGDLEAWGLLSRFRQVLVLGVAGDPWVDEALAIVEEPVGPAPTILQVLNVWARGQQVSVVLLPPTGQAAAVAEMAGRLHDLLDDQFRSYAVTRMFISGEDLELEDSLATNVGFSLRLPVVYQSSTQDSVYRFRNDNPSPAELIREVAVTWQSPAPDADLGPDELLGWRNAFSERYYNDPQLVDTTMVAYGNVSVDGRSGVEYQAAWVSPPGAWPAGGPFITRTIRCPQQDRLYYADAWLYAPNRDKYEYMIQLQTILDSFRCR